MKIDKEKLIRLADKLQKNTSAFDEYVLQTIGNRIKLTGNLSSYDRQALANMAKIDGDLQKIYNKIAEVTEVNINEIKPMFEEVVSEIDKEYAPIYDYKNIKPIPIAENEFAQAIIKNWAEQTAESMVNLSRTSMIGFTTQNGFFNIQKAFTNVMDGAVKAVSTGETDFHSAMRKTIKDLGGSGVQVNYGSGITRRLDSVVRQNLLYGAKQSVQAYQEYIGNELGCNIFFVDYHPHPRPSHEFMGGKSFSYGKEFTKDGIRYQSGKEAIERLQDYGCLHFKTDGIAGISENPYDTDYIKKRVIDDKKPIEYNGQSKTKYEWQQKQRLLEREIRKNKDTAILAESSGDTDLVKQCRANIKAYREEYYSMSEAVGIEPDIKRASVVGFGKKM